MPEPGLDTVGRADGVTHRTPDDKSTVIFLLLIQVMRSEPKGRAEHMLEREAEVKFPTNRRGLETLEVCPHPPTPFWDFLLADSKREAAYFGRCCLMRDLQVTVPLASRTSDERPRDLLG